MIFNITSGGVAYISVSAPSGATVTASKDGMTFSQSSGVITVTSLGTWTVTCAYNITYKTHTVSVASFGSTQSVSFMDDYTSTIHVTTFPGASVVATQTGHSNLTGTANSSGVCDLTVPYDGLGDWIVTASFSSWSNSGMASFNSYGVTVNSVLDLSVPSFTYVTSGQAAYTFNQNSSTGSNSDYYFYKSGANWEFYAKTSGTLKFTGNTLIDLFLCGGGNAANNPSGINNLCYGGNGGARKTVRNITASSGNVSIIVGGQGSHSTFGSYSSSGGSVSAGGGQNNWTFYAGSNGGYCFDDSSAKCPDGNSRLVGAGGGHGGYSETDGTSQGSFTVNPTNGGSYGGGNGGSAHIDGVSWYGNNGGNATFYGGGGGGAGGYYHMNISDRRSKGTPGSGYKGFVAMRNKR